MAPPAGRFRPGRYLAFFILIVVGLYSLVFFTGDGQAKPKLGIDLQGGTRVTLTARTPDGAEPSRESLAQAKQIIETRVNGIGVAGTEVVLDGNNVVITVPGEQGEQAKNLGQTAKLGFRKVLVAQPAAQPVPPPNQPGQVPPPTASQPAPPPANGGGAAQGQPAPPPPPGDGTLDDKAVQEIQAAKATRQNPALFAANEGDQAAVAAAQQAQQQALAAYQCLPDDPLRGNDDPNLPLVTCLKDGTEKYVLGPVFLQGTEIADASSGLDQQGGRGWVVDLRFESEGARIWADFTSKNVNQRAAFVLDTEVVSAPNITTAILDGNTQITGDFTQAEAKNLADVLKYGSLPLSFTSSDATTVSATLGLASLEAGLIAGGIGLLLVFVYCLFYYRMLGVLTILSLGLTGVIVYGVLVLLGRWTGFTLDLAGVAGFIIAIGVTADSFVVYFERLKDEMREGRTFRSAVTRGWVRARRTILASDAVMFLAAAVLFLLAVGEVRGFAFTLGVSTVLDLIVVFLVTYPLVGLVAKSKTLSDPRISGLGAVQQVGRRKRTAAAAVKEA
ncbi:protein translocase subunit SecD [Amycolatopsis suaedae]|uniref:Protein translocase subunit SecD n=1 Tax=Amycolatopsis suaedae TaxID=2510978 RepID=A0A4Q7JDQ2_9PSEU|nr:protein translocase subunit SecD [Amycolatopsis suaedae]RZQ65557.1 protein translocase subunit SecD [Amycolatopsis suaedae]